jgi:hypothetical protein
LFFLPFVFFHVFPFLKIPFYVFFLLFFPLLRFFHLRP